MARVADFRGPNAIAERDVEQAITALKKGTRLVKCGRRGKPKFWEFKLSADEQELVWYDGKDEKVLKLSGVKQIIKGQTTAVFQRDPRPDWENRSFSLTYAERSLDLVCKDVEECEIWLTGLHALVHKKGRRPVTFPSSADTSGVPTPRFANNYLGSSENDLTQLTASGGVRATPPSSPPALELGGARVPLPTGTATASSIDSTTLNMVMHAYNNRAMYASQSSDFDSISHSAGHLALSGGGAPGGPEAGVVSSSAELMLANRSDARLSTSYAASASSKDDDSDLQDLYMWGEGLGDGVLGGGVLRVGSGGPGAKLDAALPKIMEATMVLDVQAIACGGHHAALVNKQGEVFCWGEESGGRLGHGVDADVGHPKLVDGLAGTPVEMVACGEYHTAAVSTTGELHTWGDAAHGCGLLGHGNDISHWVPKRVVGPLDGLKVASLATGPWHTALTTTSGQLFTWGDGTFGALGHGDRTSCSRPREVLALRELHGGTAVRAACGVWHTVAVVTQPAGPDGGSTMRRVYTWGDGDKGRLGHGNKATHLSPKLVEALLDHSVIQVACGHSLTVALTHLGTVYAWGSSVYGQLGVPAADGKRPVLVEGALKGEHVDEIACGAQHVLALSSRQDVYSWGKGANGRLGHGDLKDRDRPVLVDALKEKQVVRITCGSSFSAAICTHKWASSDDHSKCTGCKAPFSLTRRRHNCYNCGLVFCHSCSSKKALNAAMSPNLMKPSRVCDSCCVKLEKQAVEARAVATQAAPLHKFGPKWMRGSGGMIATTKLRGSQSFEEGEFAKPRVSGPGKREVRTGRVTPAPSPYNVPPLGGPTPPGPSPRPATPTRGISPSRRDGPSIGSSLKENELALAKEITRLRTEVETWKLRNQQLETQLQLLRSNSSEQLTQTIAMAGEEKARADAANEVIKSLTAQLQEMAENMPEGAYRFGRIGAVTIGREEAGEDRHLGRRPRYSDESVSPRDSPNGNLRASDDHRFPAPPVTRRPPRPASSAPPASTPFSSLATATSAEGDEGGLDGTSPSPAWRAPPSRHVPEGGGTVEGPAVVGVDRAIADSEAEAENNKFPTSGASGLAGVPPDDMDVTSGREQGDVPVMEMVRNEAGMYADGAHGQLAELSSNGLEDRNGTREGAADVGSRDGVDWGQGRERAGSEGGSERRGRSARAGETIIQVEAGVFVTLLGLASGGNELKRVRFSRKMFSEEQAERWWSENRPTILERYAVRSPRGADGLPGGSGHGSPGAHHSRKHSINSFSLTTPRP